MCYLLCDKQFSIWIRTGQLVLTNPEKSIPWEIIFLLATQNCLEKILHLNQLTTVSQSGGWVPETSRSFHYGQAAPRWRPLPWLVNPGNPAMSPHAEGEKQVPVTLIRLWKERGWQGRGDSLQGVPTLRRNAQKNAKTPTHRYDAQRSKNTRNPRACAYLTNRWLRG